MNEELIRAKIELYRQLLNAEHSSLALSDIEVTIMSLLAQDVHVRMKIDGHPLVSNF